jgi:hypothetical protein
VAPAARATACPDPAVAFGAQVFGVAPWGGVALLGVVWMVQVRAFPCAAATRWQPGRRVAQTRSSPNPRAMFLTPVRRSRSRSSGLRSS